MPVLPNHELDPAAEVDSALGLSTNGPDSLSTENALESPLETDDDPVDTLTWEDSYAIARMLLSQHADLPLEEVSLQMIYDWTVALPGFDDDRALANEAILKAIYQEWFEEANPL